MKRDVDYQWRLAELMAGNQMHNSTDFIPRLNERGITLSPPQVYRLVHQRPGRVYLKLIAALCDIFDCGPDDLATITAADARKKAASTGRENVVELVENARIRQNFYCASCNEERRPYRGNVCARSASVRISRERARTPTSLWSSLNSSMLCAQPIAPRRWPRRDC